MATEQRMPASDLPRKDPLSKQGIAWLCSPPEFPGNVSRAAKCSPSPNSHLQELRPQGFQEEPPAHSRAQGVSNNLMGCTATINQSSQPTTPQVGIHSLEARPRKKRKKAQRTGEKVSYGMSLFHESVTKIQPAKESL